MDKTKQVEDLKKALDLEILISSKTQELSKLNRETFRAEPIKPQKTIITSKYPEIKPSFAECVKSIEQSKLIILIVCIFFLFPVAIFLFLKEYKNGKNNAIENVKNSAEYKAKREVIDKETKQKQADADLKYQKALEEYEKVLLPQYKIEFDEWSVNHNKEIETVQNILSTSTEELSNHYENTKIIAMQYRTIPALQYIYDMISTSDYDIMQAIDLYDRSEQRKLDAERLEEQRRLTEQQKTANELAAVNASLLQEQNEIADKARRDANIAAAVGAVQRHNLNKTLKKR